MIKIIQMKNSLKLAVLILFVALYSCRSSKELTYLKDVTSKDVIKGLPNQLTDHVLGSGDILYVSIKSTNSEVNMLYNPEATMESSTMSGQSYLKYTTPSGAYLYGFEVDKEGEVKLPMFGNIKVAGGTQSAAEMIIQKKADETLKDAIVKVKLLNFKITVMGEVKMPGVYYNYNNSINLFEALAMSGGNTDFATIKNVVVIRPSSEGNKTFNLDLTSKEIYNSEAFYLHPNDYILVQPDKHKNIQLNGQAISLILTSASALVSLISILFVAKVL